MNNRTLVWFRHDLRLKDNPALAYACDLGDVIPVYIHDTNFSHSTKAGQASNWWLHNSLQALNKALDNQLIFCKGDTFETLTRLLQQENCNGLVWNRTYDPSFHQRDIYLKSNFSKNYMVKSFNGSLLWEPDHIKTKTGAQYKVFTPFYQKGCLQAPSPRYPIDKPSINIVTRNQMGVGVHDLNLLPRVNWYKKLEDKWQIGEKGAWQQLKQFIQASSASYQENRDYPSLNNISFLSPYLHFGEISPNQIWYSLSQNITKTNAANVNSFLRQLGWRDFCHYQLYHFPQLSEENMNPKFNQFKWLKAHDSLACWQQGKTGIPIVDAGMRELWQTGFMHNRVRMITASFLVKNLLVDWRIGADWFMDTLVDADIASNSANWQWVAGCGSDAAPYFRIFNPILQGEKFDKQGMYVRKYCPELAQLPDKYIHQPWAAPTQILEAAGVKLNIDYPAPIVDLKESRIRALEEYKLLNNTIGVNHQQM